MITDDVELKQKSKQQKKREAEAVRALGAELVGLSAEHTRVVFDKIELPAKLQEALQDCRSIKANKARRRQLQYIGKLMRDIDTAPIQLLLAEFKRGGQVATAQLHHLERWRERLLSEGDAALDELLQLHPEVNARHLQQLIARALKESDQKNPPRAARLLFKYLRQLEK